MSARDITGGVAANYVLPAASGIPGQVLAVGVPAPTLNQLVWATAAPTLVTSYTLTLYEVGGDGSTAKISGNLYRSGTIMILAMQGAATQMNTVVSGPIISQTVVPGPPLGMVTFALPIFDATLGVNTVAVMAIDSSGTVSLGPDAAARFAPGKTLLLLGFTLVWEAAA